MSVVFNAENTSFAFEFSNKISRLDDSSTQGSTKYSRDVRKRMLEDGSTQYDVRLSPVYLEHTFLSLKARMQAIIRLIEAQDSHELGALPIAISSRYQFRVNSRSHNNVIVNQLDRIGKYLDSRDLSIELVEVPLVQADPIDDFSLALYTHPNG